MAQTVFKIFFGDEVRRFLLDGTPTWLEFLSTLELEILKGSSFHRELLLQYSLDESNVESERVTVSTSEEWQQAMKQLESQNVKKFYIVEGNGVYFKDSPPPQTLCFNIEVSNRNIEGVYKTSVQKNEGGWEPYHDFAIMLDGTVKLNGKPVFNCRIDKNKRLEWGMERNTTSGDITFTATDNGNIFYGSLTLEDGSKLLFSGAQFQEATMEQIYPQEHLDVMSSEVPSFLASFFPGGKILPRHIPEWLQDAIIVKPVEGHQFDVDLDINVDALYSALNNKAFVGLDQKQYDVALEYFHYAQTLRPNDPVLLYNIACALALCGDADGALDSLEKAHSAGYCNWAHMVGDQDLQSILPLSRFDELVQKMAN